MIGFWKFQELRNRSSLARVSIARPKKMHKMRTSCVGWKGDQNHTKFWINCIFLKKQKKSWGGREMGSSRSADFKNIGVIMLTLSPVWRFTFLWRHLSEMPTANHNIAFWPTRNFIGSRDFVLKNIDLLAKMLGRWPFLLMVIVCLFARCCAHVCACFFFC